MTNQEIYDVIQKHGGIRPASRETGIPESTIRSKMKKFTPNLPDHAFVPAAEDFTGTHVDEGGIETVNFARSQEAMKAPITKRYIITSAQNNCPVHQGFLDSLKALAKDQSAELMIGYVLYDKAGYRGLVRQGKKREKATVWWDKATQPFMMNKRGRLAKRLAVCGELDTLASVQNPLNGLKSYCGRSSIIVPHNKFAFECVESRPHQMPKEMYTTGSVTQPRFIQRKAGQLAHFHHVIGALLVEVDRKGYFYVHHLNAEDNGSFYWLDKRVEKGKVKKNKGGVSALVVGDVHVEKKDEDQDNLLFDIIRDFKPRATFLHDLIDFTSRNYHNIKDPVFRASKKYDLIETELQCAGEFLKSTTQAAGIGNKVYVVASNHEVGLSRWVKETDWKTDIVNASFYLTLAERMVVHAEEGVYFNPLEWSIDDHLCYSLTGVEYLKLDESIEVEGIECGMHGHVGPSGARGNVRAFAKLGFKTFTAHTHSPSIHDGCYTVGVLGNLDMGYNRGPSKWMHTHGIIYPNGKRAFIMVKNGKWRA